MKFQYRFNKVLSKTNNVIGGFLFKCDNRTKAKHFMMDEKIEFKEMKNIQLKILKNYISKDGALK